MHDSETRPLRVMFLLTSMPIGGAETLLVNMVRKMDRNRCIPMIACLKEKGVLGEEISSEVEVFDQLIHHKFDFSVVGRLKKIFVQNQVDAVVTIGAGDKMFWGRIAARRAKVPVILSALHSTGWPDGVGRLNRFLTGITDGFIAVARQHADFQIREEGFPQDKVFLIPNGIDTEHFQFLESARLDWRKQLGIDLSAPTVGIVAALRPEKNHDLFLNAAQLVKSQMPDSQFIIAGDGPERQRLEKLAQQTKLHSSVKFIGSTKDVRGVLCACDLFALTSRNEASPVSIMEALACSRPVVATDVGSVDESVIEGETGFLVSSDDSQAMAQSWLTILGDASLRQKLGRQGRQHIVRSSSLESMTRNYVELIETLYDRKSRTPDPIDGTVSWTYESPLDRSISSSI
ncbi:MAG: glycosyltransferase [Planctomycetota bacterium]